MIDSIGLILGVTLVFCLLWNYLNSQLRTGRRSSFVTSCILSGLFAWAGIEFLSLLELVNFYGVCSLTLLYFLIIFFKWIKIPFGDRKQFWVLPKIIFKNPFFYLIGGILLITFILGIIYPANTWDSLTYHLPRVEHWIQNQNINFYYTTIDRQLFSAPFAEIMILYVRLLSSHNYLINSVQWFAFLGCLIVISNIGKQIGLSKQQQVYSTLFLATLPIAILQASSSQNDLVVTFWILCATDRLLLWKQDKTIRHFVELGIAIGLAVLTKGTAYIVLAPLVIYFAFLCIKNKTYFWKGILAGLICLLINLPHYIRTYEKYGKPIEAYSGTQSNFGLNSFVLAGFGNLYINIPIPIGSPEKINLELSDVEHDVFPYGPIQFYSTEQVEILLRHIFTFHEDTVKNTVHSLLLIGSIILLLIFRKKGHWRYICFVFSCFVLFCFCIPWQPWITRLQTPLFALAAPIFAMGMGCIRFKQIRYILLILLSIYSLFPTFFNYSRPLKSIGGGIPYLGLHTSYFSVWNSTRERLIFSDNTLLYNDFSKITDLLNSKDPIHIGLVIDLDGGEYPFWYVSENRLRKISSINIINIDSLSSDYDYIIVADKNIIEKYLKIDQSYSYSVLKRNDWTGRSWELIYPTENNN